MIVFGRFIDITVVNSEDFTMAKLEQTLFAPKTGESLHDNVPAAKLLGKRTHQVPGKLSVSELFFEVPTNYSRAQDGSLRLFARSAERFEKPVDMSKKEIKQPPWLLFLQGGPGTSCKSPQFYPWTEILLEKGYQVCVALRLLQTSLKQVRFYS